MRTLSLRLRLLLSFGALLAVLIGAHGWFFFSAGAAPSATWLAGSGLVGLLIAGLAYAVLAEFLELKAITGSLAG